MPERNLGQIVDQLGVICELGEHDHAIDAMVLLRVANTEDGGTRFAVAYSGHTDFIVRRGMAELGKDFEEMGACAAIAGEDEEGDEWL